VLSAAGAAVEFVIPKEGNIPITDKYSLTAVLTPTPRWPDAMCIIDPATKVVFTSKFFSAHVAPGLLNSKVSGGTQQQDVPASRPGQFSVKKHLRPAPHSQGSSST
jgi:flavorubredoxin